MSPKPTAESRKPKAFESITLGGVEYSVTPAEAEVLQTLRAEFDAAREPPSDETGWFQAIELFPGKLARARDQRNTLRRLAVKRLVKIQRGGGVERFAPVILDPDEQTCRLCACTETTACHDDELGPCWWAEPTLCSHCVRNPRRAG